MNLRKGRSPSAWRRLRALSMAAVLVLATGACFSTPTPVPIPTLLPTPTPQPTAPPTATWTPTPRPPATATPTSTPPYLITTVPLGTTAVVGDLVLTATQIISPTGALPSEEESGVRFVLLDLTVKNEGDRVIGINSGRELILKDGDEQIYKISARAVAATGGTTPDVDLAPGETIRAQVGFEVPVDAGGLVLSFAADKFRAGRIFISLP